MSSLRAIAKGGSFSGRAVEWIQGSGIWGFTVEAVAHVVLGYDQHEGAVG